MPLQRTFSNIMHHISHRLNSHHTLMDTRGAHLHQEMRVVKRLDLPHQAPSRHKRQALPSQHIHPFHQICRPSIGHRHNVIRNAGLPEAGWSAGGGRRVIKP